MVGENQKSVNIILQNANYRLEINAERDQSTELASPIMGLMDGRIKESMTSKVNVLLLDVKRNKQIFNGWGRNTGLEVAGNINEIKI